MDISVFEGEHNVSDSFGNSLCWEDTSGTLVLRLEGCSSIGSRMHKIKEWTNAILTDLASV